jgi:hypothetical protein
MKTNLFILALVLFSCKKEETPQTVVTTPHEKECRCDEILYQKIGQDPWFTMVGYQDSLIISCDSTKEQFNLDSSFVRILSCYEI